jgi:Sec-independent protein translocase protein TatA
MGVKIISYVLLQMTTSMEELQKELSEKKSEFRRVQDEQSKRDKEHVSDGSLQSLRNMLMALQKENSSLKVSIDHAYTVIIVLIQ